MCRPPALAITTCLVLGPEDTAEDPNTPRNHFRPSTVLVKEHIVCTAEEPSSLSWTTGLPPRHLSLCSPKPRVTTFPRVLPPSGERFPLLMLIQRVWKRWLLFQMHIHLHKATEMTQNQGNMTPSNKYYKPPVCDPKEIEMQELPVK